jgi:cytoskeleton protein RodZ
VSEADTQTAGTVAPGAALAAAREALNLSVTEVARQLKLSVSQIEALEAGAYEKLPGPVFVRGFIRNYARLLRLDPEQMLRAVEPGLPEQAASGEVPLSKDIPFPPAKTRLWPWYSAAMLVLIGGLAVYEFYWNEPEYTVSKRAPVTPSATVAAEPVPAVSAPVTPTSSYTPPAQDADVTSAKVADAPQPVTATNDDRHPAPGERLMHLVFDEESWVEIRDGSGNVIFSQLNQAGSERRVYGKPPLSLIVGNAHGVRLTYNAKPVDLESHTKIDVARLTLE